MSKKQKTTEYLMIFAAALIALVLLAVGAFAQTGGLRFFGPLSRLITPNGDQLNDKAIFCFDNPADSDITGKVYTLLGTEVATMSSRSTGTGSGCPTAGAFKPQLMTWDGFSNGSSVRSGIYVYRISSELKVYSGTMIVLR
jgi:hypothetical protein